LYLHLFRLESEATAHVTFYLRGFVA